MAKSRRSKKQEPKEPVCHFKSGDIVTTSFKPLFFTFSQPIKVLSVTRSQFGISGWDLSVDTDNGTRKIDSSLFSKAER